MPGPPKGVRFGGRQKGTPNKLTAQIKALASEHGPSMINELVNIALTARSPIARVAAANAILDRAYGKPKQEIDVNAEVNHTADGAYADLIAGLELAARAAARGISRTIEVDQIGPPRSIEH